MIGAGVALITFPKVGMMRGLSSGQRVTHNVPDWIPPSAVPPASRGPGGHEGRTPLANGRPIKPILKKKAYGVTTEPCKPCVD